MFTFTPLQGALSESAAQQSLLELDGGVKVLIDVGWDESFDSSQLKELEKQVPTLSLILLTHATAPHLAAYAHCCKNFPLFTRIPVYATRPVIDLGRTLIQDLYSSTPLAATTIPRSSLAEIAYSYSQAPSADHNFLLQPPTADEIARYFSLIQPLKYSQPHQPLPSPFSPPLNGLTITAYSSGHTVGGTIWHIQHGLESIVYAVDWNQARENVVPGAAWLGGGATAASEVIEQLRKPTALVCSSRGAEKVVPGGGRSKRDEQLLETVKACTARGGTVLIPVDSSSRVLELSYLLEHAWRTDAEEYKDSKGERGGALKAARLFLASRSARSTMRHAKSMLEWMDENIVRELEATADIQKRSRAWRDGRRDDIDDRRDGKRGDKDDDQESAPGPFDFRFVRLLEQKGQVDKALKLAAEAGDGPGTVILASDTSLEWGFSKEVLRSIAGDPKNLIILTEKPSLNPNRPSIARTLWQWWNEARGEDEAGSGDVADPVPGGGRQLELQEARRQALEGSELTLYQQWLATQRQLQATLQNGGATSLEASADAVDDVSSESSSESDESETEQQGKALNTLTTMGQASRKRVVLNDEDLGVTILVKKKGIYDYDVRGKRGRDRMFPISAKKRRCDEFGELIRPEDFLKAEEKEDAESDNADNTNERDAGDGIGKKRKWDDVGRGAAGPSKRPQLDGMASAADADAAGATVDGLDELDGVEEEKEPQVLGPSKLIKSAESLAVELHIAFIDLSGLHDKRSLNMLIPLIQPRKLVLVAGNAAETASLEADCKRILSAQLGAPEENAVDVYTPAVGAWIDASVDTNAWVVKLAEALYKRLKWQSVKGLGIVTVTGQLLGTEQQAAAAAAAAETDDAKAGADGEGANKRQKTAETGEGEESTAAAAATAPQPQPQPAAQTVPTLDVVPTSMASASRSLAQPLHVGDLRLADLRKAMQAAGHTAEFRGEGSLLIDGSVAVRKSATGRIELESIGLPTDGGPATQLGGTFYAVKRMIYDGLAVVAGG